MRIAIDASNIKAGGGITHLAECLDALEPGALDITGIVVCSGSDTLLRLPERTWLEKRVLPLRRGGALARVVGARDQVLASLELSADILIIPGGSYVGSFRPFVALAQNLLPFDAIERAREGISMKRLRLYVLEHLQSRTFRRADGVIYMTEISKSQIEARMGFHPAHARVVHHGTHKRFFLSAKVQRTFEEFSTRSPFRVLYLSILEPYKHQDVVIEAVSNLRRRGFPIALDLIGPGEPRDRAQVEAQIHRLDPRREFLTYRGPVPYNELVSAYRGMDAFVFASSCETFGIILLEAMAAGLPLACSHRSAMPEVVGNAAVYFDPLVPQSLSSALERMARDVGLRRTLAFQAHAQARLFSWKKCAKQTFGFVRGVYDDYQRGKRN